MAKFHLPDLAASGILLLKISTIQTKPTSGENLTMNSTEDSKDDRVDRMIHEAKQAKSLQERRAKAIDAILEFRKTTKYISTEEILQIKKELQESIFDGIVG